MVGLKLGGEARAYPFSVLARRVSAQGRLRDPFLLQAATQAHERAVATKASRLAAEAKR